MIKILIILFIALIVSVISFLVLDKKANNIFRKEGNTIQVTKLVKYVNISAAAILIEVALLLSTVILFKVILFR